MNTVEYIIKKLEELGVNDFFGVADYYNFKILNAINEKNNTGWVGTTSVQNAVFAADGYARIKGYGAVVTSYGSNETAAINGISGCFAENIPVVHLVGVPSVKELQACSNDKFLRSENLIYTNMFKDITSNAVCLSKENAKFEIDNSFKILVKEKRPIYIAVPEDIAEHKISDTYVDSEWESDKDVLEIVVSKITKKISSSKRPVVLGDILVKRFDAELEYREFAEKSGIPVSNLLSGTNIINMDYDRYIGSYYGKYKNPIAQKYVEDSDCMIAVGLLNCSNNSLNSKILKKINSHIAIYGTYTYIDNKRYDNVKMADVLSSITKDIESKKSDIKKPNIGYKDKNYTEEELSADYIYTRLQEYVRENDIIVSDSGSTAFGIMQMKLPEGVDVLSQFVWDSKGWATSAGLGVCTAKPNSRVIVVTGDSSHQTAAMEIGTYLKNNTKPIFIVINNDGCSYKRYQYGNINCEYCDIPQVNYAKLSRAFEGDIWAIKAANSEDLDKALKVTQIMNKMCYIDVVTKRDDIPELAKEFFSNNKEMIFAGAVQGQEPQKLQETEIIKDEEPQKEEPQKEEVPEISESQTVPEENTETEQEPEHTDDTNEQEKISEESTEDNYKEVDLTQYQSSGYKYETIVHANILEPEEEEEEENE